MIIRGKPAIEESYIKCNASSTSIFTHAGFSPLFFDGEFSYFAKSDRDFMKAYQEYIQNGGDIE